MAVNFVMINIETCMYDTKDNSNRFKPFKATNSEKTMKLREHFFVSFITASNRVLFLPV